jgi:hypothetical protein
MNKSVIYIVGATVLVGGAYLFLKNKKAKDLAKLDEIGGTTPSGTTTNLSTTSDGVSPSDASINLSNAVVLVPKRMDLYRKTRNEYGYKIWGAKLVEIDKKLANLGYKVDANGLLVKIVVDINLGEAILILQERRRLPNTKDSDAQRKTLDQKLANLGYKVGNFGQLVKITSSSLSTTTDGVNTTDANVNLANANLLLPQRMDLYRKTRVEFGYKIWGAKLVEIDKKLANLGYKVDANGQLVKI